MKLYLLSFCVIMGLINQVSAQLFLNGADVISNSLALIYVNNDSLIIENNSQFFQNGYLRIDKDLVSESGNLLNDGETHVLNNILINDSIEGLSNTSQIFLTGNWINNNIFEPGLGTVTLNGGVQTLSGTENTSFYNLVNMGVLSDKKELIGVDAIVLNNLDLGNVEFATNQNTLRVTNANISSISRQDGFVSSLGLGRLERSTNSTNEYLFPTGSTDGVTRYRPIDLIPSNNSSNVYGVRLANIDATIDGFDVTVLNDSLCEVNPNFYHRLYSSGSSADITMNYLPSDDGNWNSMANWQQTVWYKTNNETNGSNNTFSTVQTINISDFSNPAFALAVSKPQLSLIDELIIDNGETVTLTPSYNGSSSSDFYWSPNENMDCNTCLETMVSPSQTTLYNIEVTVSENCKINDSVLVIIRPLDLLFPDAFSPNADGLNDYFKPVGSDVEEFIMNIYNRWGENIYSTNNIAEGWNGIYKGELSPIDVYTYTVQYKFNNIDKRESKSGNFTLIR